VKFKKQSGEFKEPKRTR